MQDPLPPPQPSSPNFLGITSFVIAIINVIGSFLMLIVAGIIETSTPGGVSEDSTIALIIGLLAIACLLLGLIGMGIGVAGILVRHRQKVFAILGTIINTAVFVIILGIIGFGLSLEQ